MIGRSVSVSDVGMAVRSREREQLVDLNLWTSPLLRKGDWPRDGIA
jgi:hypothetical protein